MSKTDKTRPARIQIAEQAIERHDHSRGECDLTSLAEWTRMKRMDRWSHRCQWEPKDWHAVSYSRNGGDHWFMENKIKRKYPDWKAS